MAHMDAPKYEVPTITELGSVAQFTRRDELALDWDGNIFRGPGIIDALGGGGGS